METFQTLSFQFSRAFETRKRASRGSAPFDVDEFVCLADGSPTWMKHLCQELHDDMMPNDARYAAIEAAADLIAEAKADDARGAFAYAEENIPEPFETHKIMSWLSASPGNRARANEALAEGIVDQIETACMYAMMDETRELAQRIADWIETEEWYQNQ